MKATQGHLRLDQSYTLKGVEYNGKYSEASLTSVSWQCENCTQLISNIATVEGTIDGKQYRIGLDCAATLTSIEPSEIAQAKKQLAREAKFRKWIIESMIYWIVDPKNEDFALLFGTEPMFFDGEFQMPACDWRCNRAKYAAALRVEKMRTLIQTRKVESEYVEGYFMTYYIFKTNQ